MDNSIDQQYNQNTDYNEVVKQIQSLHGIDLFLIEIHYCRYGANEYMLSLLEIVEIFNKFKKTIQEINNEDELLKMLPRNKNGSFKNGSRSEIRACNICRFDDTYSNSYQYYSFFIKVIDRVPNFYFKEVWNSPNNEKSVIFS